MSTQAPEENQWQPVRLLPVEKWSCVEDRSLVDNEIARKGPWSVIHVRPAEPDFSVVEGFREWGCCADNFYQIHPDETSRLGHSHKRPVYVCEHQILAD